MDFNAIADAVDNELAHFGIKGMKWGVRRQDGPDGTVTSQMALLRNKKTGDFHEIKPNGKPGKVLAKASDVDKDGVVNLRHQPEHKSADHDRAVAALTKAAEKGHHALSNEELKVITNRVKAEKEFAQLTTGQKTKLQQQVDEMKLQKEYRALLAEQAMANRSSGRKVVDSLMKVAAEQASNQAGELGKKMVEDMLGINQPSKGDKLLAEMKKKNEIMKVHKENRTLKKDLFDLGERSTTEAFKVNPAKVKIGRG